jgi:ankyrin repeat protein
MGSTCHSKSTSSPHSPGRPRLVSRLSLVRLYLPLLCLAAGRAFGADTVVEAVDKPAPLVEAAHAGDDAKATALLTAQPHPDVNQKTSDGTSALHWAVYHNDVSLIDRLLALGADANANNDYGSAPLSEAAVVGNPAVVKKLLKAGANVESANGDGQTALMITARTSNLDVAKLLLDHGAKVNARERWRGQTALMWAAAESQPEMVRLLIKHRAGVNERSDLTNFERQVTSEPRMQARPSGGLTPLLFAARKGCLDCARYLVAAGADVNLTDPDGVAPLLLATLNFNFDVAAFLVQHGADVDKWDLWGRTALYGAIDMNTLPVGGRADRPPSSATTGLQLIDILLKAGANPNPQLKLFPPYRSLRDDRGADTVLTVGATPLLRAAKAGDIAAMKLLLTHGANPNLPTATGVTPLMAAAGNGSSNLDTRGRYKTEAQAVDAVNVLLASGVDINQRDNNGQTALYGAATWGWNDLVKTLAARNADLSIKDARGRTAADIAMGTNGGGSGRASVTPHPETAALLKQLMAGAGAPVAENSQSAKPRAPPIASTE